MNPRFAPKIALAVALALGLAATAHTPAWSDSDARYELMEAIKDGNDDKAKALIAAHPELIQPGEPPDNGPLFEAASRGRIKVIEAILATGASVELTRKGYHTPLTTAIMDNQPQVIDLLLAHGADVNAKGFYGMTPTMLAAREGKWELLDRLLARGGDINATTTDDGDTALDFVVREMKRPKASSQYKEQAVALRARGAKLNHPELAQEGTQAAAPAAPPQATPPKAERKATAEEINAAIQANLRAHGYSTASSSSSEPSPAVARISDAARKAAISLGYSVAREGRRGSTDFRNFRNRAVTIETEVVERGNGSIRFTCLVASSDSDEREQAIRVYRAVFFKLLGIESASQAGFDIDGNILDVD